MDNLTPQFEEVIQEFVKAESISPSSSTLVISDEFQRLKEVVGGNKNAPFAWLKFFGDSAVHNLQDESILKLRCKDVKIEDARKYTENMPFAKAYVNFDREASVIQQNYYYYSIFLNFLIQFIHLFFLSPFFQFQNNFYQIIKSILV